MNRRNTNKWEDLQDALSEVEIIATSLNGQIENDIVKIALSDIAKFARGAIERTERCQKLLEFHGYKFAVIDPATGDVRVATADESMRLIMNFPPREAGSALDLIRRYNEAVKNGEAPSSTSWDWSTQQKGK